MAWVDRLLTGGELSSCSFLAFYLLLSLLFRGSHVLIIARGDLLHKKEGIATLILLNQAMIYYIQILEFMKCHCVQQLQISADMK